MSILKLFCYILLFCIFFLFQNIHSQIIDNYIILNPYQSQNPAIGRTMGGATIALPDSIPSIFDNPASLSYLRNIKGFMSLHTYNGKLNVSDSDEVGLKSHQWNEILTVGALAISFPFHLFQRSFTIAASYNGAVPYDYRIGEDYFSIRPKYSGQLRTATAGIGTQLSSTFRIGLGWTHWFGKRKLTANYPRGDASVEKASKFSGKLFHLGIQKDISKRFTLGTVVYFPFQLSINNTEIFYHKPNYRNETSYEQKQNFSGAIQIGFAYIITSSLKFGFNYGYQHGFDTKMQIDSNSMETSYSHNSSIAGGLEYNFHINKISLPLYLMYKATWLPMLDDEKVDRMFFGNPSTQYGKNPISHMIELGGSIRLRYFTIYLASQWKHTGKFWKSAPPITCAWIPPSSFDVNKRNISLGIAVNL